MTFLLSPRSRIGLLAALLLFVPPVFWKLPVPDSTRHMELRSLLSSQETWLRMKEGEPDAWKRPSLRGEPRLRKPPLLVWANLLVWQGLERDTPPDVLTARARGLSATLALLALVMTAVLAERVLGPSQGGHTALLLCGMYYVLKESRLATYDIHLFAWASTACAGLLLLADREAGRLRLAGAPLALLGCCAAVFTKGPVGLLVPLLAWGVGCFCLERPRFRMATAGWPLLIALLVYGLWLQQVAWNVPGAKETLLAEWAQDRENPQPLLYYLVVLGMIFPWTLPALRSAAYFPRKVPRRETYPWIVIGIALLLLMCFENKRQRYLLPLLPFVAMGLLQLWNRVVAGANAQAHPLERLHVALLGLLSLGLPLFMLLQPILLDKQAIKGLELPGAGALAAAVTALLLGSVATLLLQALRQGKRGRLLPLTTLWISIAWTLTMHFYSDSYHGKHRHRAVAARLRALPTELPLYVLHSSDLYPLLEDGVLYHAVRRIPARSPSEIPPGAWVIATDSENAPANWIERDRWQARKNLVLYETTPAEK
jgi:hypothetical protein